MIPPRKSPKTREEKIIEKGDKLYPQLRYGRCCIPCLIKYKVRPSENMHHIIRRANPITRFELLNLLPVCAECHAKIHAGKLHEPISEEQRDWLTQLSNKSLKGICIARGITREEYFEEQLKRIKEQILI